MKYCSKCGLQLEDTTMFCPRCGERCDGKPSAEPQKKKDILHDEKIGNRVLALVVGIILILIGFGSCFGGCFDLSDKPLVEFQVTGEVSFYQAEQ